MSAHITKEKNTESGYICPTCRIKMLLGLPSETSHEVVFEKLDELASCVSRPCRSSEGNESLCPYGELAMQYPLVPFNRKEAIDTIQCFRDFLAANKWDDGRRLTKKDRASLKKTISNFNPERFPESISPVFAKVKCGLSGLACPAFFPAQIAPSN